MEERIIELETRISYQDHMIGELNDVVTSQQKQIDRLEKQVQRMEQHLKGRAVPGWPVTMKRRLRRTTDLMPVSVPVKQGYSCRIPKAGVRYV